MPQTAVRPATGRRRRIPVPEAAAIAAAIIIGALAIPRLADPRRGELTFTNETRWRIGVEAIDEDGDRLLLTTVGDGRTATVREVRHAEQWRLRWTFEGEPVAETTMTDAELADAGHRVAVPASVAERLESVDAPPAP